MEKRTCTIDGCSAPHIARGWCRRHYARWKAHGTPLGGEDRGPTQGTPEDRFFAKIVVVDDCWIWQGNKTLGGYGMLSRQGRRQYVHRWAYEHFTGNVIPEKYQIDHLCRTPSCANPDHLEPVTPLENCRRADSPASINGKKTHCVRGHEFTPENTFIYQGKHRMCRACDAIRARERRRKVATL